MTLSNRHDRFGVIFALQGELVSKRAANASTIEIDSLRLARLDGVGVHLRLESGWSIGLVDLLFPEKLC